MTAQPPRDGPALATGPATRRVTLPEVTLAVTEAGPPDGPPVLLLHGFPDRASLWAPQVAALADAGHRVVAPDLRGFGDSDRPEGVEHYTMPRLVADVLALLDALGMDRVAVAGHDWGAALGWALARRSDRVGRYAALSVGHPGAVATAGPDAVIAQARRSWYMPWFLLPGVAEDALPRDDWAFWRAWARPDAPADDALLARQVADLARPGALTAALNWYRGCLDARRLVDLRVPAFPPLEIPVLGVWSDGDIALTEDQMTGSARFCPDFRYARVRGAGHWIPADAPDEVSALLVDFLTAS